MDKCCSSVSFFEVRPERSMTVCLVSSRRPILGTAHLLILNPSRAIDAFTSRKKIYIKRTERRNDSDRQKRFFEKNSSVIHWIFIRTLLLVEFQVPKLKHQCIELHLCTAVCMSIEHWGITSFFLRCTSKNHQKNCSSSEHFCLKNQFIVRFTSSLEKKTVASRLFTDHCPLSTVPISRVHKI